MVDLKGYILSNYSTYCHLLDEHHSLDATFHSLHNQLQKAKQETALLDSKLQ